MQIFKIFFSQKGRLSRKDTFCECECVSVRAAFTKDMQNPCKNKLNHLMI